MYMTFRKLLGIEHTFLDIGSCEDLLIECQFIPSTACKKEGIKKYCPKLCDTCGKNKHFLYTRTYSYIIKFYP